MKSTCAPPIEPSIQFLLEAGIGPRVINAAARKRLRLAKPWFHTSKCSTPLTGDVFQDIIELGTSALQAHVETLIFDDPVQIAFNGLRQTRIRVCGVIDYVIDRSQMRVWAEPSPLRRHERAAKEIAPWGYPWDRAIDDIELIDPLRKPAWLNYVACRPGWFGYAFAHGHAAQQHLFVMRQELDRALGEVAIRVWRKVRREPALIALRHRLATALAQYIGPELIELAMRARVDGTLAGLNARHLALVWQQRSAFSNMQRENPRLLPLLTAWLRSSPQSRVLKLTDALPDIREAVLATGLPPKAWRFLARHGMKRLLPEQVSNAMVWPKLQKSLFALDAARWPAVPPRGFLRLLHDCAGVPISHDSATENACPGWFWQMACNEAVARRGNAAAYGQLFDRLPYLAWLVRNFGMKPDQNQRRNTFAWLSRLADEHEQSAHLEDGPTWFLWLQDICWGTSNPLEVVPLLSPGALLKEAIALHNCADSFENDCREEGVVLLSLRDRRSGKRVALARLDRNGDSWSLGRVAGPCNLAVPSWVMQAASLAADTVRYHHGQRPALPPPTLQDSVGGGGDTGDDEIDFS